MMNLIKVEPEKEQAYSILVWLVFVLLLVLSVWNLWRWWSRPEQTLPHPDPEVSDTLRSALEPNDRVPYSIP
jgi:energy-converting hydrogenase Eha subunit F